MYEKVLNLTYYKGDDQYSDGDIEDVMLNELENSDDVYSILSKYDQWPILYHLSPVRENVLSWYDFDPNGSALEIGSGCGAITGLLCKKLERVVGIDLSKKRSMINAAKNKKYNNLEIMVGNFEDIKLEEKFDYVTLIGVLEYSIYYISGDNQFATMLEKAKNFLKPNGKLIIAIENKYGLKYFSGAAEDHTGRMFDGIKNYHGVDKVRTFSRDTLKNMLEDAGFNKIDFYYPFPDYKMPVIVYSDHYLPTNVSDKDTNICYDRNRYRLFDEGKAFEGICEAGLFPQFANSFLVISE